MKTELIIKLLFISSGLLIALQLPWYIGVELYAKNNFVKKTATVIRIDDSGECFEGNLSRSRAGGLRKPCKAPVYEYQDPSGNLLTSIDRDITSFKEGGLFDKKVNDKVPVYYPENNPQSVFFKSGINGYLPWLMPLYIALLIATIGLTLYSFSIIREYLRNKWSRY